MSAALVLNTLPFVWIAGYLHMPETISFMGYYVMEGLKGMIVPMAIVMSSTADVAEPGLRATLFSFILVGFSVAVILGAGVGGLLSAAAAVNTAVVLCTISIGLSAGFVPGGCPIVPGLSCPVSSEVQNLSAAPTLMQVIVTEKQLSALCRAGLSILSDATRFSP
jgi:hypothetical protein